MMKGAFVILSLLFMLLVLPQQQRTEAKGWVRKVVCHVACKSVCNYVCTSAGCNWVCRPVCGKVCNGKKKREFGGASFDEGVRTFNICYYQHFLTDHIKSS